MNIMSANCRCPPVDVNKKVNGIKNDLSKRESLNCPNVLFRLTKLEASLLVLLPYIQHSEKFSDSLHNIVRKIVSEYISFMVK